MSMMLSISASIPHCGSRSVVGPRIKQQPPPVRWPASSTNFRGDSALALPKLLQLLEKEGFRYASLLKANAVLERKIAPLLKRPVGRPSHQPKQFDARFRNWAGSWECARRVVVKVGCQASELFPRVGFLVTNRKGSTKRVVRFSNRRGTAEPWIKEGKNAVKAFSRSPCQRNARHGALGSLPRAARSSSEWENRCPCPFAGVTSPYSTIETVAPEGVFLGKIG
jgi:hypothetical protein